MRIESGDRASLSRRSLVSGSIAVLVLVRLVSWINTALVSRDSLTYIELARYWLTGQIEKALAHPYHPLYPMMIAGMAKIGGGSLEHAAMGVSLVASALTVPALVILFYRYRNERIVFLGLLFFCVSPYLVRYAADILTEPLYLFFVAWAVALFLLAVSSRMALGWFAMAGVSVGLAYLTRPEGLVVGVAGVVWLVVTEWTSLKRWGWGLVVFLVSVSCVAAPYMVYLHRESGEWILTKKKKIETFVRHAYGESGVVKKGQQIEGPMVKTLPKGVDKKRAEFLRNRSKWEWEQADRIRQALGRRYVPHVETPSSVVGFLVIFLKSMAITAFGFFHAMFLPIGIFVVFRLFYLNRFPWNKFDTFIVIFSLLYWGMLSALLSGYGYVSRRHYCAAIVFWFGWAAIGFTYVCDMLDRRIASQFFDQKIFGSILLSLVLVVTVVKGTKPYRVEKVGRKIVGAWIKKRKPSQTDCVILTSMIRIGYYAGCHSIPFYRVREEDVDALRRHKIAFVILKRKEAATAPSFLNLLKKFGYQEVYRYTNTLGNQDLLVYSYRRT